MVPRANGPPPGRTPTEAPPGSAPQRPLDRIGAQPLILGLFLPTQSGGWTPSSAPRGTDWTYAYNAELTRRAEAGGFDLAFALAQWLGAGGWGGRTRYREMSIDPLVVTAGLAAETERMVLISTVHVLYGWHPLHLAKFGATLDHMSGGRWGLNLVTGYFPDEIRMFGQPQPEHDQRYRMAAEFTELMERLWSSEENVSVEGRYWRLDQAFVSPKPRFGRPIMVNAGSSEAGIEYAARYSDLIFITSPAGAEPEAALAALPDHNRRIKQQAAAHGRSVKTIINPHVICRDSRAEVREVCDAILAGEDVEAVDNLMRGFGAGDQRSWRGHQREQRIIGGNLQLFGTPDQVVEWFGRLKESGCDGVQINFFDYLPDLEYFLAKVLPLMHQAGLRLPAPAPSET